MNKSLYPLERLEQPLVSETDTERTYRAVKLGNQLVALLVSEPNTDKVTLSCFPMKYLKLMLF